jgi:signal transduction histidine kinase
MASMQTRRAPSKKPDRLRRCIIGGLVILLSSGSLWAARQGDNRLDAPLSPASPLQLQGRPAVLIIFGDDASQPWIQPLSDGVSRVLYQEGATSPEPYFEYLDAVRFPDQAHRDLFRETTRLKYAGTRFSLIVPIAGTAIRFVNDARDALWPGVPVLFTQYNAGRPLSVPVRPHDFVLGFEYSFGAALATIKKIFPDTTHVAVTWDEDMAGSDQASDAAAGFQDAGLQTIDLNGLPLTALKERLGRLPDHSVALLGVSSGRLDSDHSMSLAWPLCEQASSAANRPAFMLGAHFLGCGIVGGRLRNFNSIGALVGMRVLAALAGRQAPSEMIPVDAFTELAFDGRQLERWSVDDRRLPPGSIVRFRQPSLWRDYRLQVCVTVGTVFVLAALVGGLFYERRARLRAEVASTRHLAVAAHAHRLAEMTSLTASIGHELSQPLGSIRMNTDAADRLIASNRATPEGLREILHAIGREDARAMEIIERLRAMSKKQEIRRRPTDVFAVLRDSIALVAQDAIARQVHTDWRLPSSQYLVLGDPVLLQQVIVNLVLNAFDAMADTPAERRRIVVETSMSSSSVDILVRDSGPGISAQLAGRLFEPFVTTKTSGLGLGLSIVRSIVVAHDGQIEGHNAPEGGAVFCVTLPHAAMSRRGDDKETCAVAR